MRDKYKKYDRFKLTSEQIFSLVDLYGTDKTVSEQLEVISIPNFIVESDDGSYYAFTNNNGLTVHAGNTYENLLDFNVMFSNGRMGFLFNYKNEAYVDELINTFSIEVYENYLRQIVVLYGVLNTLSVHRPTLFRIADCQVTVPKDVVKSGRIKRTSETKLIRLISLNDGELPNRHNNITCPCWGVAGHYRHYKNGKVVYIQPYRKGKKRDDPEAYQPKTYLI